jgi:hypothetical protein
MLWKAEEYGALYSTCHEKESSSARISRLWCILRLSQKRTVSRARCYLRILQKSSRQSAMTMGEELIL